MIHLFKPRKIDSIIFDIEWYENFTEENNNIIVYLNFTKAIDGQKERISIYNITKIFYFWDMTNISKNK